MPRICIRPFHSSFTPPCARRKMGTSDIVVFSGSSHPDLAQKIVQHLNISMGRSTCRKLNNGETYVELEQTVRGKDVYIIQSGCGDVNDTLMELLIFISACKTACAERVTAVLPCFPYSRQDQRANMRSSISAKLVANLITVAGANHVISMDVHASQIQGFFDVVFDHLYAEPAVLYWIKTNVPDWKDSIIMSPDAGGAKRVATVAEQLQVDFGMVDKSSSTSSNSNRPRIVGNVKDRTVIILDDLVDTGGTLIYAAEKVMEAGAKKVMAVATHGVLSECSLMHLMDSPLEQMVVTNTIPQEENLAKCSKLTVIDVSSIFAEAIRRTHNGESISYLFTNVPM